MPLENYLPDYDLDNLRTIVPKNHNFNMLVTEWPEFIKADWDKIKKAMAEPYAVIDGRNALHQDRLIAIGFKYSGTGREL